MRTRQAAFSFVRHRIVPNATGRNPARREYSRRTCSFGIGTQVLLRNSVAPVDPVLWRSRVQHLWRCFVAGMNSPHVRHGVFSPDTTSPTSLPEVVYFSIAINPRSLVCRRHGGLRRIVINSRSTHAKFQSRNCKSRIWNLVKCRPGCSLPVTSSTPIRAEPLHSEAQGQPG